MAATLLLATEADEGWGHIAPWESFVAQAIVQGMRVHRAAPNLGQLQTMESWQPGVGLWQAPVLRNALPLLPVAPKSWPELLLSLGYADAAQLTGAVRAWVSILVHLKPDVVLADYAPALMAAARVVGVPCLEVGSGFCVPPLSPTVCHFPGVRVAGNRVLNEAASKLTAAFNAALQSCACGETLASLSGMGRWPARRVVLSPPELDHYGVRSDVLYAGFLVGAAAGALPVEPSDLWSALTPSPRVLGYLKPATPGLGALIEQLSEENIGTYLVVPGHEGVEEGDRHGCVTITRRFVNLPKALQHADVYLSNGGLHGVGLALQAGCWPVVVPMQAEQVAMAKNLMSLHLGALWLPAAPVTSGRLLQTMLGSKARPTPLVRGGVGAEELLLSLVCELQKA